MRQVSYAVLHVIVATLALAAACRDGSVPEDATAQHDAPIDRRRDSAVLDSSGPNLAPILSLAFDVPATTLPIGHYQRLSATASPTTSAHPFSLAAAPCLLKLEGSNSPPARTLALESASPLTITHLILFAPPDASPASGCTVKSPDPSVAISAQTVQVQPPTYRVVHVGDHLV